MKCILPIALAGTALAMMAPAALADHTMPAYLCQPLNDNNRQECCDAANWREIIPPWQQRQCERTVNDRQARNDDADDDDDGDHNPPPPPPPPGCTGNDCGPPETHDRGNPGNDKDVGRAGEMPDKNMIGNSNDDVGVRGASDLHHAYTGNGNGPPSN